MSGTISTDVLNNKNWAKCNLANDIHLRNNLLEILHNTNKDVSYTGLPEDPAALYQYFDNKKHLIGLKGSKKKLQLFPDQYDLVLPSNKREVDSKSFDTTLIVTLIRKFILGCPFAATVEKAAVFRNDLKHGTLDDFKTKQQLKTKLLTIQSYLQNMNYSRIGEFVVADIIKDDKFVLDIDDHLNLMETLKNDLKIDQEDKIEHAKKNMMADIIKQLKPRLKGLFAVIFFFCSINFEISQ